VSVHWQVNEHNVHDCIGDITLLISDERLFLALELLEKVEGWVAEHRGGITGLHHPVVEKVVAKLESDEMSRSLQRLKERTAECQEALDDLESVSMVAEFW